MDRRWEVIPLPEVEDWIFGLDGPDRNLVAAAIDRLEDKGPTLGRPYVDRVKGSKYHNLKELRPGSSGRSEIRILFAFDLRRRAVLLTAGDKAGLWEEWYKVNIPKAEARFEKWLNGEE